MVGGGGVNISEVKVYASCLEVLKNLATRSFWFIGFKSKNTLYGCIKRFKTRNKTIFRC